MFYPCFPAPTRARGGLSRGAGQGNIQAMLTTNSLRRATAWTAGGALLGLGLGFAAPGVVHAPDSNATASGALRPLQSRGKKKGVEARPLNPFIGTLQAAQKASLEQNVPLLVHVILEGEEQNDEYRDTILPYPELTVACERAIVLIANNGEHELKQAKEEIEGRTVESLVCSSYPVFANCAQHREPWDSIYVAYHDENGDMQCPQTILLAPDGKEFWRHNDGNPPQPKTVLKKLQAAQKAAGPGLSREELSEIKRLVKEAGRSTDGKLWGQAWRDWSGVLAIIEVGAFAEQARTAQPGLVERMRAQVNELAKGLVPGTAAATYAELDALLAEFASTPVEPELRKVLKAAEKDKEIADEIKAWQLEREATGLLQEAEDCFAAEDASCARKALRKLFGKKYSGTEAAARGRRAFPEHVPGDK